MAYGLETAAGSASHDVPLDLKGERMRRYWTTVEMRELRNLYPDMENGAIGAVLGRSWAAVQVMACKLGLRKSPRFVAGFCRFQKGHATWNKGKPWSPAGSRATQFTNGHRGARQRPVGAERVERDGVMVKVAEPDVWKPKARVVWEKRFGPIPDGMIVRLRDGNKENCAPQNLMLIGRDDQMRLNGKVRRPRVKPAIAWIAPLRMAA